MLTTERLILTPLTLADAQNLLELNRDPEVVRYTGDGPMFNLIDAEKVIREHSLPQQAYKMGRMSIRLKDGSYLGWCGLKYFPETNEVDLGYRLHKKFWGKGYATEAAKASLAYGFEELHLPMIMAKAMPDNVASIKVMQKLGMTFKGYHHDPTDPHPFVRYELTSQEWKACKD